MKNKLPLPLEKHIQTAIIGYLRAKGWYVMRLNSGSMRSIDKRGKMFMTKLTDAGTPDIMAFKPYPKGYSGSTGKTYLLFIEVKRSAKHPPTPLQLAKMRELEEYGATCHVIWSIEQLQELGI